MKNYTLGRGKLHFGQFKPGTQSPRGERYLGNSPDVSYSSDSQRLDHYYSDAGIRTKDASVLLQMDFAGGFSLDDIQMENISLVFLGDSSTLTVAASTVAAEIHSAVEVGYSYQLGSTDANPTGARNVSTVVVKNDATTPVTYVAGTDYVVDETLGRITILESGAIVDGTNLTVGYSVEESTRKRVISKGQTIEGSLRYIAENAAGENIDFFMPWVQITPDGDYSLKGDDWQVMNFTLSILKKGNLEAIYADGRPYNP